MDQTKLKAHLFDAEQSLTWARQAIEEGDAAATYEALREAHKQTSLAANEIAPDRPLSLTE